MINCFECCQNKSCGVEFSSIILWKHFPFPENGWVCLFLQESHIVYLETLSPSAHIKLSLLMYLLLWFLKRKISPLKTSLSCLWDDALSFLIRFLLQGSITCLFHCYEILSYKVYLVLSLFRLGPFFSMILLHKFLHLWSAIPCLFL